MSGNHHQKQATQLFCLRHPKKGIKYIDVGPELFKDLSDRLICDECFTIRAKDKKQAELLQPIKTQEFLEYSAAVVTNTVSYKPTNSYQKPEIMDFKNCELEHVILEGNSRGYAPRVIHYIDNLKILVVGSESGQITLWNFEDVPKVYFRLTEKNTIRCISSLTYGGKTYLLSAVDKNVIVYLFKNKIPVQETILPGATFVNHLLYDSKSAKLYILYWFSAIIEYDLRSNFKSFQMINTDLFGLKPPNATMELLEDGKMAVEHGGGLSILVPNSLMVTHCSTYQRTAYGLGYLKTRREFLLRVTNRETFVVNRENMQFVAKFKSAVEGADFPGFRFLPNEDDTQVCTNSNEGSIYIYEDNGIFRRGLEGYITSSSGIEYCTNIKKLVVGDEKTGILLVFRSKGPQIIQDNEITTLSNASSSPKISTSTQNLKGLNTKSSQIEVSQPKKIRQNKSKAIKHEKSRSRTNSRSHSYENDNSSMEKEKKFEEKEISPRKVVIKEVDTEGNEKVAFKHLRRRKFVVSLKRKILKNYFKKTVENEICYVKAPTKTKEIKAKYIKVNSSDSEEYLKSEESNFEDEL